MPALFFGPLLLLATVASAQRGWPPRAPAPLGRIPTAPPSSLSAAGFVAHPAHLDGRARAKADGLEWATRSARALFGLGGGYGVTAEIDVRNVGRREALLHHAPFVISGARGRMERRRFVAETAFGGAVWPARDCGDVAALTRLAPGESTTLAVTHPAHSRLRRGLIAAGQAERLVISAHSRCATDSPSESVRVAEITLVAPRRHSMPARISITRAR